MGPRGGIQAPDNVIFTTPRSRLPSTHMEYLDINLIHSQLGHLCSNLDWPKKTTNVELHEVH